MNAGESRKTIRYFQFLTEKNTAPEKLVKLSIATVWEDANLSDTSLDAVDSRALLHIALGKPKTVTV